MLTSAPSRVLFRTVFLFTTLSLLASAAEDNGATSKYSPDVAGPSLEGETAIKRFRVPKGFKVELFAAEPLLANPVAFCIDEQGRFYVAETFRLHSGVTDIRGHMNWLNDDLATRSVEDRVAFMKRFEGKRIGDYTKDSDRVRLITDTNRDGQADKATVFSEGYNEIADGIGAGLLARKGQVYYANIPHLWLLQDKNGDGVAEIKKSLHYGYGVRVGFIGHDLHGLRMGPDGKLYFSIGDRGARIKTGPGKTVENPETGAVYRCNPDGSDLEIFAHGFRNPQELAFDQYGNLWTGENNSDGGDPARWVYVVEGGDSGWRIGWQFITQPNARGPWMAERMCYPQTEGQAAYFLPPIANIANGPSGLAYYPGAGLPARYNEHFFLCDFRGVTGSGVYSFAVKPRGAGFEMIDRSEFVWEVLVTDGDFGYDGCFYLTDWVNGWGKTGKGRIYRVFDPATAKTPVVDETRKLFAEGFDHRSMAELAGLLTHPDMRVRQEAQFALANKGDAAVLTFTLVASRNTNRLARLHAIWGLGQMSRKQAAVNALLPLLRDNDAEVRAQTAKVLGDAKAGIAVDGLIALLRDAEARPKFFAAIALGKLRREGAVPTLLEMLRANDNKDRYLRHAGVMGLAGCANVETLKRLAQDQSAGARMAAVVALRRLESPEIAAFLHDSDPLVTAEAARAINDVPIHRALPQLAAPIDDASRLSGLPATTEKTVGSREPILRRVINANFRLGRESHAMALAGFAANTNAPDALRAEALAALGEWPKPSGRDRVTGLWRPLAPRDAKVAAAALEPHLAELLRSAANSVKVAATKAAAQLGVATATANAFDLVADTKQTSELRIEALKSLAAVNDSKLKGALKLALSDRDESVRKEATRIQAQLQPQDAAEHLKATLENGTTGEKQNALAALGSLTNNPAADEILLEWLDKLLAKEVPPEAQLDVLDAAAKRTTPAFVARLRKFEEARPAEDNLRSWRECLVGGNIEAGKKIFLERAEVSCVRCHKVSGEGGETGPDLTGIGARKPREYLLESIVLPNKDVAAGFESVVVSLMNGSTYAGVVKSETATGLELNTPEDGLVKLNKAEIKSRERGLSGMPEELRQVLTKQDLRDLVEFLSGLK
jgi:quinoprotein glucose dehydrogenase